MESKKTIGLYARCSTEKQDLITQKHQLDTYLEYYSKNNTVVYSKEFFDDGYSGSNQNRPELQKLMKAVEDNELNTVIISKLDRLARSVDDLRSLVKFFENKDCTLIIIKENIDTKSAQGRLFFTMLSAFIEFERDTIIQRMNDGRAYALKHGSKSGKPCHRPKKQIDMDKLKVMKNQNMGIHTMAKLLGVSRTVIRDRLKDII